MPLTTIDVLRSMAWSAQARPCSPRSTWATPAWPLSKLRTDAWALCQGAEWWVRSSRLTPTKTGASHRLLDLLAELDGCDSVAHRLIFHQRLSHPSHRGFQQERYF